MKRKAILLTAILIIFTLLACSCTGKKQSNKQTNTDNVQDTTITDSENTDQSSSQTTPNGCQHVFGDWKTSKASTCAKEGEKLRNCTLCSAIEEASIAKTEDHTPVTDAAVPASCTSTGLSEGKHCSVCNKVIQKQNTTPMTDHTVVIDKAISATCKNSGRTEGRHCSRCNKVLVAPSVIAKLKHTEVTDAAISATCTTDGKTEGKHCSVCNETIIAQKTIPASHSYSEWIIEKESSCESEGLRYKTCSSCQSRKEEIIPIIHNYVNGVCKCGSMKPSEGLLFERIDGAYRLIGLGTCTDTAIVVPSTYNNLPVIAIGSEAFLIDSNANEIITSIVLCEGIKTIEDKAFAWCKTVKSISLPDSIEYIGSEAFLYNQDLESIVIPEKVTVISQAMFRDCHSLKSITLGSQITTIENWAFHYCGIESLILPDTITQIGQGAFLESSIKTCNIPKNLTALGVEAFCKSDIEEIVFDGVLSEIPARAFKDCDSLRSVTFNSSIKKIGEGAFNHASNLNKVIFSVGLTAIEKEAFAYCSEITTLLLPQSLISIGKEAFRYNSGLTQLELPSTLTKIEDGAFIYCEKLKSVTIPASLIDGGATIFAACGLETVRFEDGSKTVYASMFKGCSKLSEVYLPQTLTTIQTYAFNGCSSLVISDLPFSLTTVDTGAFKGCTFKNFVLSSTHENFAGLFSGAKIENLTLTNDLKKISSNMFSNSDITSIIIPEGVKEICENAFSNCKALTEVSFPSTLERISKEAFSGCSNISALNLPENLKHIGDNAFDGLALIKTLVLPENLESIGTAAFVNCEALDEISIPNLNFEGVFENCGISTVYFYGTKDEAQTYICKVFPYSSNVQIYCIDGAPIRLAYSYNVPGTDILWSLTSDGILTISGNGEVPYVNMSTMAYKDLVTKLVIGEGITNFNTSTHHESSFKYFTNISEVEFASTLVSFDKEMLKGCVWYETFNSGSEAVYFGETLVMVPSSLSGTFTVKDGTVTIGKRAFANCSELSEISLPLSVTTIENAAFSGCTSLLGITLHEGITVIQREAFYMCHSLTELTIPSTVITMDGVAVSCENLKKIVISDNSSLSLNGSIASYCSSLETVIIGTGVSELPINTLYACSSLKYVIIRGNVTKIDNSAFWNTPADRLFLCYDENTAELLKKKYADFVYLYSESEPTENGQFWGFSETGNIKIY